MMHQFQAHLTSDEMAEILLYGDIGGFFDGITAKEFAEAVQELGDVEAINVRINSFGGIAADGTAMFNVLRRHPALVTVDVEGYAASSASIVAMAGDEIRMATGSLMMIHDAWGVAMGNAAEISSYAEGLARASEAIRDIYAERTGNDNGKIREWMLAETWFTADEAVANGFATDAVDTLAIAAMGDPDRHKFRAFPTRLELEEPRSEESRSEPVGSRSVDVKTRLRLTRARARAPQLVRG